MVDGHNVLLGLSQPLGGPCSTGRRNDPVHPCFAVIAQKPESTWGRKEFPICRVSTAASRGRGQYFDAVETEAFGRANIVATVQARLDGLPPEPLADVLERERAERAEVVEQLRRMRD